MSMKKLESWNFIRVHAYFFSMILLVLTNHNAFSETNTSLQNQRNGVIKQYISWLGKGNYDAISHLFSNQGVAVSSSGIPDNPRHFYKTLFTKTISSPNSSLINLFEGTLDNDMMTAYFDFSWNNSGGKKVTAKFLDLFMFEKDSIKIKAVYVFSNTFQGDIMKQLDKILEKN